ncbi:uncharacterized protein LAJ45_07070 [Morchella importuna]|uniref:uncharacterized protein n=1 Tax=Morchella importuna TaxID=1174673 RepID=UPI001E8D4885|nr:uncharacterized protein LAJ45_07070 [Morchella importuna]KAH8148727.1 hypothetical protein LAJ45_07070 [Morchella importuna]
MEGDLNLSQALGGLRIANQTEDSPPPSPRTGTSSNSNNPSTIHIPDLHSFYSHQNYSANSPTSNAPAGRPYQSNASSGYPSQNISSSASINSNPQMYPDYARMTREPSRGSLSGPSGAASRQTQRERSNTDRSYRQSHPTVKKGVKDFNFGRTLGEGSYSTVVAATDRTTLKEYAIKVLDKRHIIKEKKVKYVNIEKNTLNRLGEHPGVVRLYYTFQDERSLYFVLDLATGGELLGFLKRMTTFDEECTRYYSAQILDTIEYMHMKGVIHRDLKPENVLLDDQMRVKITDFGTAKILDPPEKTGDGTNGDSANGAEYVSPELLTYKAACKASDLWAFGCIVFQLLSGRPPFKAGNEYQTFQKIVNLEYEFPKGFPPVAKDLVERLLVLDPAKRLSIEHIKNHEFFEGVEWGRKLWKQKAPRLKPYVPPPTEAKIIKLDDYASASNSSHRNGASSNGGPPGSRPQPPRVITELAPPSQLDIEWSPVLTRSNERILKLGNAVVHTKAPKKFARFFTGNNSKKRQRLVMITTCARAIVAASGGDKKMKMEINLQGSGVIARKVTDSTWALDTRDKTYTFEDPKTSASEWLETIDRAREIASANHPPDDSFMASTMSSPSSTLTLEAITSHSHQQARGTGDSGDGRTNKRFSKRNSRHGLAAVF